MLGKDYEGQDCSLARALEVVGERWTLLIVRDAFYGVRRFSDFAAHLDIPRAVLSDRLAGLDLPAEDDPQRDQSRWPAMAEAIAARFMTRSRDEWAALLETRST